jgi:hypothetical protein
MSASGQKSDSAQRHSNGALCSRLTDDVFIEFDDNLARRHVVQRGKKRFFLAGNGAVAARRKN